MGFSIPIPDEIIDCVVEYLQSDLETLKICAVVSRSFLSATRRRLLSSIHIDHSSASQSLWELLRLKPESALFVRELRITTTLDNRGPECWFANDKSLPTILNKLQGLQVISLSAPYPYTRYFEWPDISIQLQSALVKCFKSSILLEIFISDIWDLPVSMIVHWTHLRRLRLHDIEFDHGSGEQVLHVPAQALGQLEALELWQIRKPTPTMISPLCGKLRLLSIPQCDRNTLSCSQDVINFSVASIKSIVWNFGGIPPPGRGRCLSGI